MDLAPRWLILVHQVPPKPDYLRVKIRRRLHGIGAVAIKSTVYALPRNDQASEDFEWVLREIVEAGGQGAVCEATFVGGLSDAEVESLFRAERARDYEEIAADAKKLLEKPPTEASRADLRSGLSRLRKRREQVRAIDFVGASEGATVDSRLREIEKAIADAAPEPVDRPRGERMTERPTGRTWVTRKGVYVDRIASAWLIGRFIDPRAKFKFVSARGYKPGRNELRFDMFDGEYTHEGDRCTFEVLLGRFDLSDPGLVAIGEIVHDLDLKDEKYGRPETAGVEQVIAGIAMAHDGDAVRVERGSAVLDDLHASLSKNAVKRRSRKRKR